MPEANDLWYIQFPDGRVVKAAGTAVVRQHVAAGRLPAGTQLRRSRDDEWRAVEHWSEFVDLAPTPAANGPLGPNGMTSPGVSTISSRLDPASLPLAGVRPLGGLLAALDTAVVKPMLLPAVLAGLLLGGLAALAELPWFEFTLSPPGLGWLLAAAALLVWSWLGVVLSRMAYTAVSRLRGPRWRDGTSGCLGPTLQLAVVQGLLVVLLGGAIFALRWLPGWLQAAGNAETSATFHAVAQAVTVVGLVLELVLWPALLLVLSLAAATVVEESSPGPALRQWGRLVWQKLGRLLLAEGLALGLSLVLAAPLGLLAALLVSRSPGPFVLAATLTQRVLCGLLGTVVLAYLVVANVFIYLHLRYER